MGKDQPRDKTQSQPAAQGQTHAAGPVAYAPSWVGSTCRLAFYARYSDDGQKITSTADQFAECRELAARMGIPCEQPLVFGDEAITGQGKATHKRSQYLALRKAISEGRVDVLICDQQCRLARYAKEALDFFELLKEKNVWLLTADGFDSRQPTAQLLYGIKSVFAQFFVEETQHRVRRGMVGMFERGGMVTYVPDGYLIDVVRTQEIGECQWKLDPERAPIVQDLFRMRKEGMSLHQIAAVLNARNVPLPRSQEGGERKYWRASRVWSILQNPIYKGVYVVNFGSSEGGGRRKTLQRVIPALAIVSAEDWMACQAKGKGSYRRTSDDRSGGAGTRASYGGGKHPLAGVIECGTCGVKLSCHKGARSDNATMHCIQCAHATNAGVPGRQPLYVSIKGVRLLLRWLLEKVVRGEALERYRQLLRERLVGGQAATLEHLQQDLAKAERTQLRLGRLLQQVGDDDPVLEAQYVKTREEVLLLAAKAAEAEKSVSQLNQAALRKQLDVDLSDVIERFLSEAGEPGRTRALLNRIFTIILRTKLDRYTAIFQVQVKPGAILAEATGTAVVADEMEDLWVCLKTSGSKYPVWTVEQVDMNEQH